MKISKDLTTGTMHPREALFLAGNLGAVNAEIQVPGDGASTVAVDLRGTFSLTAQVQGTIDGTNWHIIPVRPLTGGIYVASITGAVAGAWVGECAGFRTLRVIATAYTSGAAAASLVASTGMLDPSQRGAVTASIGTAVGASGAAVTLTLAAPGAGLRHYLAYLRIVRYAAAVLAASATPVTITTTNLPGTPAFTFPADAALLGTVFAYQEDFAYPVMSIAQNTATTVVCPATTGVLWRVTGGFYVAP